ncbi:MAG: flagellin [Parvularculaceae bacterium]
MSNYGFPTILQYTRLSSTVADLKSRADRARTEMVTGRIADLKATLAEQIGDAHLMKKAIADIDATQQAVSRALGRAAATQVAINRSTDTVITTATNLVSAVGTRDTNGINIAATEAKLQLEGAMSAFNTRYEGRNLFSGDAVTTGALADSGTLLNDIRGIFATATDEASLNTALDTYFNDPAGGFMTNIYTGGAGNAPRTEVAPGELIDYSARADEQPIRDLLRNLAVVVVGHEETTFVDRDSVLKNAGVSLIETTNDLAGVSARIGAAEERLAKTQDRLDAEVVAFTATYNDRTSVDMYDAAERLQAIESQLQASYIVTARVSQLSLSNFLR